ncbi:glycosyltransferase family 4 protein [Falsihalocynthiibacter sp. S25ZX9]|uniref:glycosyltransferase family 4 protein n=1 Tax=Falsihalocynthiibacter sp. S25ZX9 TaxID=3240870 RepID=UPI00350F710C
MISDFSKVLGGASKLAVLQADLLQARGIPVTFFCGDDGETLAQGITSVALDGHRLLESKKLSAALNGLWNTNAKVALSQWINKNDTPRTIYHVHGYHQTLSPSVLASLRAVRDRVVMHAHDYFLACPNGAFFDYPAGTTCARRPMSRACVTHNCDKRSYAQKLWRTSRQALQNKARRALCPEVTTIMIHEGMRDYLFRDGADGPITVVPNPAEPLLESPVKADRNRDIIYVGDIHSYKGVELLARAGRQAGVQIRFVGAGHDLATLKKSYPEHKFDGWQDRDGLRRVLTGARLLVSPTLGPEPFGLAPAEALLSGIPVLLSDSMLLCPEIVKLDMGRGFAAGDCNSLAVMLGLLKGDDPLVGRLSLNACNRADCLSLKLEDWGDALLAVYAGMQTRGTVRIQPTK